MLQTRYEMNRRPTNGGACTGDAMLVYSIAGGKLGRVVDGLLNDVGDVTNLEGKLGQTERRKRNRSDRLPSVSPPIHLIVSVPRFFFLPRPSRVPVRAL